MSKDCLDPIRKAWKASYKMYTYHQLMVALLNPQPPAKKIHLPTAMVSTLHYFNQLPHQIRVLHLESSVLWKNNASESNITTVLQFFCNTESKPVLPLCNFIANSNLCTLPS